MGAMVVQCPIIPPNLENEGLEAFYMAFTEFRATRGLNFKPSSCVCLAKFGMMPVLIHEKRHKIRRWKWNPVFALNTSGGAPDEGGGQENLDTEGPGTGQTRLGAIVGAASRQLLEKLNTARKNFPMKIFLLLLGFYTANALATILGQTGDWDVLVAGVVVAAIEGIGMLVYRKPSSMSVGRLRSLLFMVNYWKAGVCLGLFVDAFKLGS